MASKHILFALAAFAAGSSAQAQVGAAVTLDAGTTGLGVHASFDDVFLTA